MVIELNSGKVVNRISARPNQIQYFFKATRTVGYLERRSRHQPKGANSGDVGEK